MIEEHIIKPVNKFSLNLTELWKFRELLYFFCWRDIKVKYKQTYLGVAWVVLQPLFMMMVYTFLFRNILNTDSQGLSYPVFVYSGLLLWNLFSTSLSSSGDSMVANANIIKKIYFPRLIIPISSTLTCAFDFFISLGMFSLLLLYFRPEGNYLLYFVCLPVSLLITLLTSMGIGTFLSAVNVKYRDFRYVLPFLIQALFFFTPVVYTEQSAGKALSFYKYIQILNPMSMAVKLIRLPITQEPFDVYGVLFGILMATLLFVTGIFVFRKTEAHFADLA